HGLPLAAPSGALDLVLLALHLHRRHRRRGVDRDEGQRHRLIDVAVRRHERELRRVRPRQPRPNDAHGEVPQIVQRKLSPPGLADRLFALTEEYLAYLHSRGSALGGPRLPMGSDRRAAQKEKDPPYTLDNLPSARHYALPRTASRKCRYGRRSRPRGYC